MSLGHLSKVGIGLAGVVVSIAGFLSAHNAMSADSTGCGALTAQKDTVNLSTVASSATVGVLVYDRTWSENVVVDNPDATFETASLVKLLVALDALERNKSAELVHRMLARSDDNIASSLWRVDLVERWGDEIGLTGTAPPQSPGRWGDTPTTARDVACVYRYILEQSPHRDVIMNALRDAAPQGADGSDQTFGIPDAVGDSPSAVKQGWACCRTSRVLHTSGLVGDDDRYIVVALTAHPSEMDWGTASRHTTDIVSAALDHVQNTP